MEFSPQTYKSNTDLPFPNFCDNQVTLLVILIAELLAIVLTFSHGGGNLMLFTYLAYSSLFIQSVALVDATLICYTQRYLARMSTLHMIVVIYIGMQVVTLLITKLSFFVIETASLGLVPYEGWKTIALIRNMGISAIITAVVMRYFYVRHQWRKRLLAENRARVDALQARIRPHFLFNSMNTIASLIHSNPDKAEQAVLDLADLFRSTLAEDNQIPLMQEIDITKQYLRVEGLRLGNRLQVQWHIPPLDQPLLVPTLSLQPLVENAIYHGIEPLATGGIISISIAIFSDHFTLSVSNPVTQSSLHKKKHGNQIALNNIRQRLQLHYGDASSLNIRNEQTEYQITLIIPLPSKPL